MMIGQTVSHYRILERLGEGGMGVVYRAEDTRLKRNVALKFLPPRMSSNEEAKTRFIHEAQTASALDHPNVCTIHEICESEDGRMFIVMACYEGESLDEKVRKGPQPLKEILDIAAQIALGLEKAHSMQIVHRDIKPSNIFITHDSRALILDFGLAKLQGLTQITKTGTTLGTLAYMAPEQIRGTQVDHRADIWSFGVLLFEMITGQLPFEGDYEAALIYTVLNEDPKSLQSLREGVPDNICRVVHKAIEKNPAERWQTMRQIIETMKEPGIKTFSGKQKRSIIVLPFANMSADAEQEYFCDGITEEIINALAQLKKLRVIARTSAFAFKGKNVDVREIGSKLGVDTLLEGSVRKSGHQVRVTAQLVNTEDGSHIWSEKYDRKLDDIFKIQDEISAEIAHQMQIKFKMSERSPVESRYSEDVESYTLYLKGRHHWNNLTKEGLKKALDYFDQVIERDPDYAPAYAGRADCHGRAAWYFYYPPRDQLPLAKSAAEKALILDEDLAEAHASLGFINMLYDRDWIKAEQEFTRAVELNPGNPTAHAYFSIYHAARGEHEKSISEANIALDLDPLSLFSYLNLGSRYFYAGDYEKAVETINKIFELNPGFTIAHYYLSFSYAQLGWYEKALESVKRVVDEFGKSDPIFYAALGLAFAKAGKKSEAKAILEELSELSRSATFSMIFIPMIHISLGEIDPAFKALEKALEAYDPLIIWLKSDPTLTQLSSDPRHTALLKKVGLQSA